jgi:tetratricopeptide (TPR) repeat protein
MTTSALPAPRHVRPLALGVALTAVLGASWLLAGPGRPASIVTTAATPAPATIGAPNGPLPGPDSTLAQIDRGITAWSVNVAGDPTDFVSATNLGSLYFTRGRLTGALDDYARAAAAAERATTANPTDPTARNLVALLSLTTHDFPAALATAEAIYRADPTQLQALATIGDAQLELGSYDAAAAAFGTLARAQQGPAIDARLAHLAALQGRPADALKLSASALTAARTAGTTGTALSWYAFLDGTLAFQDGQLMRAEASFRAALAAWPRSYTALAGLARTRAARGDTAEAISLYQQAAAIVPQPQTLAALGDLYALAGRQDEAQQQYDTVRAIATLAAVNRQVYNRELALFDANHGVEPAEALRLATAELATRKDVYGWDAYAWALHANGRDREAEAAMIPARALGTRDALFSYHAGMIAAGLGDTARARDLLTEALAINPGFDPLQASRARAALATLR